MVANGVKQQNGNVETVSSQWKENVFFFSLTMTDQAVPDDPNQTKENEVKISDKLIRRILFFF